MSDGSGVSLARKFRATLKRCGTWGIALGIILAPEVSAHGDIATFSLKFSRNGTYPSLIVN